MRSKKRCLLVLALLAMSPHPLSAEESATVHPYRPGEVQLIRAVTDEDAATYDFRGILSPNKNLMGVRYYGRPWGPTEIPLPRMNGGKPISLVSQSGRDIVLLKGRGVDPNRGGPVSLIFLRSGIDDDYRELHLELVRGSDASWQVYATERSGRKRLDSIVVQRRTVPIIGKVGVGRVFVYYNRALTEAYDTGDLQSF